MFLLFLLLQAPGLEFDSQGNPKLPGMSEQCLLM